MMTKKSKYEGEFFKEGLEAIDDLDKDGSAFWEEQRQNMIRSGALRKREAIFCARNLKGIECEKLKNIDSAVHHYEENIADNRVNTISSFPYCRLMIIYRRNKDFDNEIRILEKALDVFNSKTTEDDISLEKLRKRLLKAQLLKSK